MAFQPRKGEFAVNDSVGSVLSQVPDTPTAQALKSLVPASRLKRYNSAAKGALLDAARIYVLDAQLRGSLLELIHFAEVSLRDAFHTTLSVHYGDDWYTGTAVVLDDRTRERFRDAAVRVTIASATPERIIAEASFGAWADLLEAGSVSSGGAALGGRADYERDLWTGRLENLFSAVTFTGASSRRQQAASLLRRVRRLRNRIAHHESVIFGIHQPGERDRSGNHRRQLPSSALHDVRTLIDTFCSPSGAAWLGTCTHCEDLLADPLASSGLATVRALMKRTVWF